MSTALNFMCPAPGNWQWPSWQQGYTFISSVSPAKSLGLHHARAHPLVPGSAAWRRHPRGELWNPVLLLAFLNNPLILLHPWTGFPVLRSDVGRLMVHWSSFDYYHLLTINTNPEISQCPARELVYIPCQVLFRKSPSRKLNRAWFCPCKECLVLPSRLLCSKVALVSLSTLHRSDDDQLLYSSAVVLEPVPLPQCGLRGEISISFNSRLWPRIYPEL